MFDDVKQYKDESCIKSDATFRFCVIVCVSEKSLGCEIVKILTIVSRKLHMINCRLKFEC